MNTVFYFFFFYFSLFFAYTVVCEFSFTVKGTVSQDFLPFFIWEKNYTWSHFNQAKTILQRYVESQMDCIMRKKVKFGNIATLLCVNCVDLAKDKYRRKARVVAAVWGTEFIFSIPCRASYFALRRIEE